MTNISIRDYILIAFLVYFAIVAFSFLSLGKQWIQNQETDLQIKKEIHIANLIGQYNSDLNGCIQAAQTAQDLTEEECIKTMNESNLAKLITSWGYEEALAIPEKPANIQP